MVAVNWRACGDPTRLVLVRSTTNQCGVCRLIFGRRNHQHVRRRAVALFSGRHGRLCLSTSAVCPGGQAEPHRVATACQCAFGRCNGRACCIGSPFRRQTASFRAETYSVPHPDYRHVAVTTNANAHDPLHSQLFEIIQVFISCYYLPSRRFRNLTLTDSYHAGVSPACSRLP
jgi:hypothetical protein